MTDADGAIHDLVPELLRGIRADLRGVKDEIVGLKCEMHIGFERLDARIDVTNQRIDITNQRLDKIIENTGDHWRDLEARVRDLERHTPPSAPAKRRVAHR